MTPIDGNLQNEGQGPLARLSAALEARLAAAFAGFMNTLEILVRPIERRLGMERIGYFFVLPNLLIFGIFVLFPMLLNFYISFTSGTEIFPQDRNFVGFGNYEFLFDCENVLEPNSCNEDLFWRGVFNTIFFVVVQVSGMVLVSLVTALVLNGKIRARGFFRSVFFYPVLLSPVVVALIWKWILQRDGVLNSLLIALGGDRVQFLVNADWAMLWVIVISIWALMGFYTLILLAGLQAIPAELYEAGQIDGTGRWQSFRFITMPLLMPTMFVVLVLSLIRAVQVFDQVYALTGGGPGTTTHFIVQYIYTVGFSSSIKRFGLAAAASVLLGATLLVLTLLQLRAARSNESG
ncbi:MAG: sugar ABC transporter permease [Anaerolineaceae bacterium]|nr:sugar ABC transporter permease [Anaerolineaceae bacterium]MCY3906619.1 sugar ABC transporter permease [Anaerolineaceae bacterium]